MIVPDYIRVWVGGTGEVDYYIVLVFCFTCAFVSCSVIFFVPFLSD